MFEINGVDQLRAAAGRDLGASAWHTVTQAHIQAFADATDDYERIHVDPEHARASGLPDTIAHGLYTLSLGPKMLYELWTVENAGVGLNYGFDRVRFVQPVPVGSRVRMAARITAVTEQPEGLRVAIEQRFEREGEGDEHTVCVADAIVFFRTPAAG